MHTHARLAPPVPRPGVYDIYWTFAARRHEAFERRVSGKPGPWTSDPILNTYKFCNVFRAADRVSQYMIRSVAYADDAGSYADRVFQIVAFRTFSNIATWEGVRSALGRAPHLEDLMSGRFEQALDQVKASNGGLYTGAFILCANKAYGFDEKHRNHVGLFKHMFGEGHLHESVRGSNSLEGVVRALEGFPLMGPFMAYQTAVDLNYSDLLGFSEDDYTQAGPGALRGLRKAFHTLGDFTPTDAIHWMVERQDAEFERLGLRFTGLFGRKLHAIDCQGLFCELDKYCREAVPELASNRSRIKARFSASSQRLDLFFPPKWQLAVPPGSMVPPGPSDGVVPQMTLGFDDAQAGSGADANRRLGKRGPRHNRSQDKPRDIAVSAMLL
ncbi:nucleotide kinase domain-containing protein [Methylobacterium sp. Leaf85]|uniref:nucleotide kinase domain-containing protein n=1 Tax=Methylobacterium sp. Leaf85 TaxID=1736241 RepID=UPI000B245A5C|nr:nucleotide kinase domain-containing protein [Methylobacterium sp. Leaf85]